MKKLFMATLLVVGCGFLVSAVTATASDIVVIHSDATIIADDFTFSGTIPVLATPVYSDVLLIDVVSTPDIVRMDLSPKTHACKWRTPKYFFMYGMRYTSNT